MPWSLIPQLLMTSWSQGLNFGSGLGLVVFHNFEPVTFNGSLIPWDGLPGSPVFGDW